MWLQPLLWLAMASPNNVTYLTEFKFKEINYITTFQGFHNGPEHIISDFIQCLRAKVQIHDHIIMTTWASEARQNKTINCNDWLCCKFMFRVSWAQYSSFWAEAATITSGLITVTGTSRTLTQCISRAGGNWMTITVRAGNNICCNFNCLLQRLSDELSSSVWSLQMRHWCVLDIGDDEEAWLDIRLSEQVSPLPTLESGLGLFATENIIIKGTLDRS